MSSGYRIERWNKPHQPNRAMLWYILESEGYRVYQWTERPYAHFARKVNEEDQCFWLVSGSIERTVDNVGTYTLQAGDRDFLPANVWHWGRVLGDEPIVYMIGKKVQTQENKDDDIFAALAEMAKPEEKPKAKKRVRKKKA